MNICTKIALAGIAGAVGVATVAKDYLGMEPKIVAEENIISEAEAIESGSEDQVIRILLGTEDTAGQYTMFTDTFPVAGGAVPPHTHHWHDEAFYVTRGRFRVDNGDMGTTTVGPNTVVFTPRGNLHAWEALDADSHFVVFYTPGGWEHYYEAARNLMPEQRADEAFMEEFLKSFDEDFQ